MIKPTELRAHSMSDILNAYESVSTEEEYHSYPAIGNSDLKKLEQHPQIFVEEVLNYQQEDSPYEDLKSHFKIGTMLEQKLLEPERFNSNFVQEPRDMETPSSGNQYEFVELILQGITPSEAYGTCYSTRNKSADQIASKGQDLFERLQTYIDFQMQSEGRGTYTADEAEILNGMIADILAHKQAKALIDHENLTRWTQLPVFGSYNGILMKGLVDLVVTDGDTLYSIDIKTTSKNPKNFPYFYHRFKYHRQQAYYMSMLKPWAKKIKGLDIKTFKSMCICTWTQAPHDTRIWEIGDDLIDQGFQETRTLLDVLDWHITHDQWDRPKSYYEGGIPTLTLDKSELIPLRL